jgi:hypothetical protein
MTVREPEISGITAFEHLRSPTPKYLARAKYSNHFQENIASPNSNQKEAPHSVDSKPT